MIKKITIVLVCILVLAVGLTVLSNLGIIPEIGLFSSGNNSGRGNGWTYEIQDGTATLTAYNGKDSVPVIPAEIDGYAVTGLGDGLFSGNTRIKEITIPEHITTYGERIFENCTELDIVNLPAGIERIPTRMLTGCTDLKSIRIPDSVKSIGTAAFSGCTGLTYVEIPDSVTSIAGDAFLNCGNLADVSVSRNLTNIGSHAFKGTSWLNTRTDEFVIIGNRILIKYNGMAESVEVPLGVTQVTDAFEDNIFPLEVTLPESVTSIGPAAFSGARSLETVNIPSRVRSIGDSAFRGCSHLLRVDLPDTLTSIGRSAFQSCSSLERLMLPEGVKTLPSLAFANCEKLRILQIPKSVETIAADIISYSGISELRVFKGSAGETFAVSNGINYSYMQQSSEDFVFQQTDDGVQVVLYTGDIYDVVIPETLAGDPVTSISDILFQHNYFVRTVELPATITNISDYSFSDMSELRTVRLPDTLESIGTGAFMNDPMLGDLPIPASVTDIAADAFIGCPSLVILADEDSYAYGWAINAGIRVKNNNAVDTELFDFVQPAGQVLVAGYSGSERAPELPRISEYNEPVTGIADSAFQGQEISEILIPEGYVTIGDYSFADDPLPFEITIPRTVESIGENCFEGSEVTINGYNGSYAETYARAHKIKFLVIYEWEL